MKDTNRSDSEARINILNMIDDVVKKLEKQPRIPRNYESIEKGALELELKDRVALKNKLAESIDKELADMKEKLQQAEKIVTGNTV